MANYRQIHTKIWKDGWYLDLSPEHKLLFVYLFSNERANLIAPESVALYWREHMGGACVRCGILGEARAELGFMCPACEYEARTGKLYRWPGCRRAPAVHSGRLMAWGLVE